MLKPKFFTLVKDEPQEFTRPNLIRETLAGLVVAFVAVPLSIAIAIASGVAPEKGLITAVVAGFLISFLGGSRVQIGGPTGAFVVIVAGIVAQYGTAGLITATVIAGILLIIMGVLKLGAIIQYIPYPITTGFTSGIAVVLFSTQINDFFGLGLNDIPAAFISKWHVYIINMPNLNLAATAIGVLALLIIIFWPKKFKYFPGSLAALTITTIIVQTTGVNVPTIESTFGEISGAIPKPVFPKLTPQIVVSLIKPAIVIAVLAGVESLLSAVVADGMIGKKHRSNMELVAQGVANIGSALFGGLPATGAIARTNANIINGGRTPVAGMMHAVFILIMMLCLMKYIKLIPMTSLAAILFVVSYKMSEWHSFVALFKAPKSDIAVLLLTFFLTVFVDLVVAIEVGIVMAALLFMRRMSAITNIVPMEDNDDDEISDPEDISKRKFNSKDIQVYEINGPFFFGAANKVLDFFDNVRDCKVLVLRMRNVPAMDATGFYALKKLYQRSKHFNVEVVFSKVQKQPLSVMKNNGFIELVGKDNFKANIDLALVRAKQIVKEINAAHEKAE